MSNKRAKVQEVGERLSRVIEASMGIRLEGFKNHVDFYFFAFFNFCLCSEVGIPYVCKGKRFA